MLDETAEVPSSDDITDAGDFNRHVSATRMGTLVMVDLVMARVTQVVGVSVSMRIHIASP